MGERCVKICSKPLSAVNIKQRIRHPISVTVPSRNSKNAASSPPIGDEMVFGELELRALICTSGAKQTV
jgi:hypothetical protein